MNVPFPDGDNLGFARAYPGGRIPRPRDRRLWPTMGKTVYDRMKTYEKLAREASHELTVDTVPGSWRYGRRYHAHRRERQGKQWYWEPERVIVHNATGRATFIMSHDAELDALQEAHEALKHYHLMLVKELADPLAVVAITY